ncbi:novel protein similar to pqlc2 isoform X1 [Xenopus tropicalis]|nr:novel protein similar to pqlc2 [Xenopus tropicalis]XP_031760985.1 novel protein similar to pqlc2 isoform X1 [Xenopus tropicalis]CAJ82980.1 novel protein similar to pqlc2 [Xenopus tropicalis]|eukprot:NP_001037886.1 novel protein similar to pqlc2 [Xenopus tropicalis]
MADNLTSPTLSPGDDIFCPNGTKWILDAFGDCAVNGRDHASVYLGMISMGLFMVCTFPQYYEAFKTKKMHEAMSIWFPLLWVATDAINLAGTYLADQLPLQKYFGIYFVVSDSLMLVVYLYFKFQDSKPKPYTALNAVCGFALLGCVATFSLLQESEPAVLTPEDVIPSRRLLSTDGDESNSVRMVIGFACGVISYGIYIIFRIPQLVTNFKRKSVEGLALGMFLFMMSGNIFYGISIVIKSPGAGETEASEALHHLPWIVGSVLCFFVDCTFMYQFITYRPRNLPEEKLPLLESNGAIPA